MHDPSVSTSMGVPAPNGAPSASARTSGVAPDLIFCCGEDGRFAWVSAAFDAFAAVAAGALAGRSVIEFVVPADRARMLRTFRRQLRRGDSQAGCDLRLAGAHGVVAEANVQVRLYTRPDGGRYFVGVARPCASAPAPVPNPEIEPAAPTAPADAAPRAGVAESLQPPHGVTAAVAAPGDAAHDEGRPSAAAFAQLEARVRELQRQLADAREGDRLKQEVLATLGHEVRPPLDTLFATADLLLEAPLPVAQRDQAMALRSVAQSLATLVGDAFDFAQIESGRMALEALAFDLRVTAAHVAASLEPVARSRGVGFRMIVGARVPSLLEGDPGRLRQVLLNLGQNALRHARGGDVVVHIDREREDDALATLVFRIEEPGAGEASARRADVFRGDDDDDDPGASRIAGSPDLGLAVARRLVHLMGGFVGVDETADGGASFWFRLAFAKQALPAAPAPAAEPSLRGLRVLVADGSPRRRRNHAGMLGAWGCDVVEADNGIDALDLVRAAAAEGRPFAIAVADMSTDGLGGEALAAAVRADRALDATALVLTTRLGRPGDAARARAAGFSAYLVQPFDASQFFAALAAVAAGAGAAPRPLVTLHTVAEARRARVRVLLAGADAVSRLVLGTALRRAGFAAEAVAGGREALARTEDARWDLVLVDLGMGDPDAPATTQAIRARERGPWRTPVVGFAAGETADGECARARAAGMDGVLGGVHDVARLVDAVERWTLGADRPGSASASAPPALGTSATAQAGPAAVAPAEPWNEPALGPAIDLERLDDGALGLPELRAELLAAFLAEIYPGLQRLEDAAVAGDAAAAAAEGGRLAVMCDAAGATGCGALVAVAAHGAAEGRTAVVVRMLPLVMREVRRCEEFASRLDRTEARHAA